ncbi:hypothetical protein HNY73_007272 [Argiope bruennichi]|uniref:Uncharacterized protein n=1 Tax=Argiope bruennichi TaxID=94029 RepID=A0A8T0FEF2_ARGBR|nr:hypothetical protein HNY73_007272 [Argiope bruennichi]
MIYTHEQQLVETRSALLWKLLNGNQPYVSKWLDLLAQRDSMHDHLNDEQYALSLSNSNENSAVTIAALEHLKVLIDRHLMHISIYMENFHRDVNWLNGALVLR